MVLSCFTFHLIWNCIKVSHVFSLQRRAPHGESEGFWNCWACFAARLRRLTWIIEVFTEKLSLMDIRTLKSSLTPGLYYHPFIQLQILFNLLSFRTFFWLWRYSLQKHNLEGFLVSRVLSIVNQNVKILVGKLSVYILRLTSNYLTGCLMRENICYTFHKSDLIKTFWLTEWGEQWIQLLLVLSPGPPCLLGLWGICTAVLHCLQRAVWLPERLPQDYSGHGQVVFLFSHSFHIIFFDHWWILFLISSRALNRLRVWGSLPKIHVIFV